MICLRFIIPLYLIIRARSPDGGVQRRHPGNDRPRITLRFAALHPGYERPARARRGPEAWVTPR
jgi:hypothetical protein